MEGLLLHALVHSAGVQDRDGGIWLLATLFGQFPFLAKLFADSAYSGSIFHTALGKILPNFKTEIVRRSDRSKGFVPLPKRWIVERTIAWLNRCRPLANADDVGAEERGLCRQWGGSSDREAFTVKVACLNDGPLLFGELDLAIDETFFVVVNESRRLFAVLDGYAHVGLLNFKFTALIILHHIELVSV
jgi:transposase